MYSKNSAVSKIISVEPTSWGLLFESQWTSVKILCDSVMFVFYKRHILENRNLVLL